MLTHIKKLTPMHSARPVGMRHVRHIFGRKVGKKIVFLHIPKCGGTSIGQAIQASYGFWECLSRQNFGHLDSAASLKGSCLSGEELMAYREKLLLYFLSNPRYKYISGHFSYSETAVVEFGGEWHFITVLRHPVSKWFSQYFFNRNKISDHFKIEADLESYVESEEGSALGSDYVRKLTQGFHWTEAASKEAVTQAIENLKKFALVGVLERLDVFKHQFEKRYGVKLNISIKNINPLAKTHQKDQITEEIRRKVENICRPDLEVYNYLLSRVLRES